MSPPACDATGPARVRELVAGGAADLPLPGGGDTWGRWLALIDATRADISCGRLIEAHADATAILAELDGSAPGEGEMWGVWAAEPPEPVLEAAPDSPGGWLLQGRKRWCSGASLCTHALVTATPSEPAGAGPGLFAVDLRQRGVTPTSGTWTAFGMRETDTESVDFVGVPGRPVGPPGGYLDRPGFWHGGMGVAACWLGAAQAVAEPLQFRSRRPDCSPLLLAHLGAVDTVLQAARWALEAAARQVDEDPDDHRGGAQLLAMQVRAVVEHAGLEVLRRSHRALGAGPVCSDARHARNVADLTIYLGQSHGDEDLAVIGGLSASRYRGSRPS